MFGFTKKPVYGWHFITDDHKWNWSGNELPVGGVKVGVRYSVKGKIRLCGNGLHASVRPSTPCSMQAP